MRGEKRGEKGITTDFDVGILEYENLLHINFNGNNFLFKRTEIAAIVEQFAIEFANYFEIENPFGTDNIEKHVIDKMQGKWKEAK